MRLPSESLLSNSSLDAGLRRDSLGRRAQYGSRGWAGGILVILFGGFFLAVGLLASTLIMAAFGLLIMFIGIPLTYQGIKQGGTKFYLTNFRLVKAKKGSIVSQFSRQIFRGKNLSSFLGVSAPPERDARQGMVPC